MEQTAENGNTTVEEKPREPIYAYLDEINPKTGKPIKIDINDGSIDFMGVRLPRHKLFCYYYTLFPSSTYHKGAESCRKAGYRPKYNKSLTQYAYSLRKRHPEIEEFIKKYEEKTIKADLIEAKNVILRRKLQQLNLNLKDFYETRKSVNEDGHEYEYIAIKNLEDISDEAAITYIQNIDFKGSMGKPVYNLVDPNKIANELLQLVEKETAAKNDEGYNVETTAEIIKGRLTVQTKIITANEEMAKSADFLSQKNDDLPEQD